MDNKYRGTKEYFLILAELITAARYRGTVTYQELASLIGLPTQGNYMGTELGKYLGAISEDEVKNHSRPMLSAIAVTVNKKPGPGFFGLAQQLGKLKSDHPADQQDFWKSERKAVYQAWRKSFNKHTKV